MNDGVHIQAFGQHAVGNPEIAKITISVWPIPTDVSIELSLVLRDAANGWLTAKGFVCGTLSELPINIKETRQ